MQNNEKILHVYLVGQCNITDKACQNDYNYVRLVIIVCLSEYLSNPFINDKVKSNYCKNSETAKI